LMLFPLKIFFRCKSWKTFFSSDHPQDLKLIFRPIF
jgi:hypothetical protein